MVAHKGFILKEFSPTTLQRPNQISCTQYTNKWLSAISIICYKSPNSSAPSNFWFVQAFHVTDTSPLDKNSI